MAENFPNLKEETDIQVQEAQRVSNKINPNSTTPRHTIITMAKANKERILKATREKQRLRYKETPTRLLTGLSAETLQARREWHDLFKVLYGEILQPRTLYTAR